MLSTTQRLAIVIDQPASDDHMHNELLSGAAGRFLKHCMSSIKINTRRVKYYSFLEYRDNKRDICAEPYISDLKTQLEEDGINCCLVLGRRATVAFGDKRGCEKIRGSILWSERFGIKYVPTYRPSEILRMYKNKILFLFDIHRAASESYSDDYSIPERDLVVNPSFEMVLEHLDYCSTLDEVAIDIEGHPDGLGMKCISVCQSPHEGMTIPFRYRSGTSCWRDVNQEITLWQKLNDLLIDPNIKKVCQNGLYELFALAYRHGILVRNLSEDTMFKQWELYAELPKDLGFISTMYTKEPYYKDEIGSDAETGYWKYCAKDSCVTLEASKAMDIKLLQNKKSYEHYRFNISLMKPYLYMSLRGCRIDMERLEEHRVRTWTAMQQQQMVVNQMTGLYMNVKSSKQLQSYLYDGLGLPKQMTREGKVTTNADALTKLYMGTEIPVILEIMLLIKLRTRLSDIYKLMPFPDGRMRSTYNPTGTDTGRLNSKATSVQGVLPQAELKFTKHGLLTLRNKHKLVYLGTNNQNITKSLRDVLIPDFPETMDFWEFDLSGADAWTVAADLAAAGNDRMLRHIQAGIKPSKVIWLLINHGDKVRQWEDQGLDILFDKTKMVPDDWTYRNLKGIQHGTNYGRAAKGVADGLLKDAINGWASSVVDGKDAAPDFAQVSLREVKKHQQAYSTMYDIDLRTEMIKKQLRDDGFIDSASGARRRFFGIRNTQDIAGELLRTALSHEPQANTTYCTNKAFLNLYQDMENRNPDQSLIADPTVMVHDALCGQSPTDRQDWVREKMEHYFDIPLTISGVELKIPVEGGFGKNWKET